jgi:[acyl-carrier-protein] S-malonyltransferase
VLALLFPGQGSQSVGMGRDVHASEPKARAVFEAADRVLGLPLSGLCFEGPEEALLPTAIQQPAILTTSVALLRALEARTGGLSPAFVAGHSLGEYTALVAAGALDFEDAVRLVHQRGRYMQEAVPSGAGAMAALMGLDAGAVESACARARAETGEVVEPANYNAPAQTVVAGSVAGVDAACTLASAAGARRALRLPVSAPFHCSLMEPAARRLAEDLAGTSFRDPSPPLVSNVEAQPNAEGPRIAELLRRQVTAPVRFVEVVERLAELGVTHVLEVGPGKVLSGLVGRIRKDLARANLAGLDDITRAAEFAALGSS